MKVSQIFPDHSPDITVVPGIPTGRTQIPVMSDRHVGDIKVEVVSGSVCTLLVNVVMTTVEVAVENKVKVGVGEHAAMSSGQ